MSKNYLEKWHEHVLEKQEKAEAKRKKELEKVWSEKLVARHLVKCVEEAGGIIFKMHPLTNKGIPDYLIFIHKRTMFVETKTTGKNCEPAQVEMHKRLKAQGVETYVLDTKITNFYDLYTYSYKTYVEADDKRYGINRRRLCKE